MRAQANRRLRDRVKRERLMPIKQALKKSFLLAILVYASVMLTVQGFKLISLQKEVACLEEQIRFHRANNEILHRRAEVMEADEFIEQAAREQLGFIKPGEVVYIKEDTSQDMP